MKNNKENKQYIIGVLWDEYVLANDYLINCPNETYRSSALYYVFEYIATQLISIKMLYNYPSEVQEDMVLNAILVAYKYFIKYDINRMKEAQVKNNVIINEKVGLYTFVDMVIAQAMYKILKKYKTKKKNEIVISYNIDDRDDIGIGCTNTIGDLAWIDIEDIDAKIDADARDKRALDFNLLLDNLQNLERVKNGKRKRKRK